MPTRIIEIADDSRHIFKSRGFLVVKDKTESGVELGQVPLDDIAAVIANAHGLSYTNSLLVELANRAVPFVLCGDNHITKGMLLSVGVHHRQAKRFDAQAYAKKSTKNRLWAEIVKAKLLNQASVLDAVGVSGEGLRKLAKKTRVGDPTNTEAQGARRYWQQLFGPDFRRNRNHPGANSLLNYGYTILRAATARAVVAAGLHPTLGLHHRNEGNPMRLVDDLMEPFRPLIDIAAISLVRSNQETLDGETKRMLVNTLYQDGHTKQGLSPTINQLSTLSTSLAQVYLEERDALELPDTFIPILLAGRYENLTHTQC